MDLTKSRIVVTGGAGFLGSHLVDALRSRGCTNLVVPRSSEYDLVNGQATRALLETTRPDIVFHLAARVGGIGANQANPGTYFHDNMQMGLNVMEQSRLLGLSKVVLLGTVCAYPKFTPVPFREDELWNGYPEETNAPYGIAKKALLVMSQAYRQQFGMNSIYLLPVNLYGPRDNFDLQTSHVIAAMIRKCLTAKRQGDREIVLWGDGSPTREFLYVEDCVDGLLRAATSYDDSEPVNLGSGQEVSMRDLATLIARLTGYDGQIRWDTSRPNGQPRRRLETSRAEKLFGFKASTSLEAGLTRTIDWYLSNQKDLRS